MIQQVECWMTSDSKTFLSYSEAEEHQERIDQIKVLNDLDICWRDTGPKHVAEELAYAGYFIVKREVYDRMLKQLNNPQVHLLVSQLVEKEIL